MAVDYNATLINNRLQQVINALDAGSSNAVMRLLASGAVASSIVLSKPSATVSGGEMIFNGLPLFDPSAIGGTVNGARFEDSSGNVVIFGLTVSASPGTADITITPSNVIIPGQTVAVTGATITGQ